MSGVIFTGHMLADVAEALWGPNWRAPMARRFARSERTIRRYASGEASIPATIVNGLLEIVREQKRALAAWEAEMEKMSAHPDTEKQIGRQNSA